MSRIRVSIIKVSYVISIFFLNVHMCLKLFKYKSCNLSVRDSTVSSGEIIITESEGPLEMFCSLYDDVIETRHKNSSNLGFFHDINEIPIHSKSITVMNETTIKLRAEKPGKYVCYLKHFKNDAESNIEQITTVCSNNITVVKIPDPVTELKATKITNTSISVSWTQPYKNNIPIKYYKVQYDNVTERVQTNMTEVTLSDLKAFHQYNINISACADKCSKPSSLQVKTAIGLPGKIENATLKFIKNINETLVLLQWNKPVNPRGPITYYEIIELLEYQNGERHVIFTNKTEKRMIHLRDVNCTDNQLRYSLMIRAFNKDKNGIYNSAWSVFPWKDCNGPETNTNMIIMGIILSIIVVALVLYIARFMYHHCQKMKDINIKLPSGLLTVNRKESRQINFPSRENNLSQLNSFEEEVSSNNLEKSNTRSTRKNSAQRKDSLRDFDTFCVKEMLVSNSKESHDPHSQTVVTSDADTPPTRNPASASYILLSDIPKLQSSSNHDPHLQTVETSDAGTSATRNPDSASYVLLSDIPKLQISSNYIPHSQFDRG